MLTALISLASANPVATAIILLAALAFIVLILVLGVTEQIMTSSGVAPATEQAVASTYARRDTNADCSFRKVTGSSALISEGTTAAGVSTSQTTSFTVDTTKELWQCDATSGTLNATLPAASGVQAGTKLTIMRTQSGGSNVVIKVSGGTDTINGSTSDITLSAQWNYRTIMRVSSTGWVVVGSS